ncbi:hypothetical protein U1Q18_036660 [Sarracenia purpurea var. burkii]
MDLFFSILNPRNKNVIQRAFGFCLWHVGTLRSLHVYQVIFEFDALAVGLTVSMGKYMAIEKSPTLVRNLGLSCLSNCEPSS